MKQLVFDSDSLILPDQIKVENGILNGSIVTTSAPDVPSAPSQDGKAIVNEQPTNVAVGSDNYVTLHIGEEDNMAVNEFDSFSQNEEISKLFKQVNVMGESNLGPVLADHFDLYTLLWNFTS